MLRIKYINLLFLGIVVFGCNTNTPKLPVISEQHTNLINQYIAPFPENTQIAVALINQDDVTYVGYVKEKNLLKPISNKDSVFGIGSISKVFTSTLLAHLINNGFVGLNDSIQNSLSFQLNSSGQRINGITYKSLANHTSGFPRMPDDYEPIINGAASVEMYSTEQLINYLKNNLFFESIPGEKYLYSNFGYALLGYLIEQNQQTDFETLLQEIICDPWILKNTTIYSEKVKDKIVLGRDSLGNCLPNVDYGVFKSAGGILSNVTDITQFIKANFTENKVLDFQRQQTKGWGNWGIALGWHITKIGGNQCAWYNHNGGTDGYRSALFMDVVSQNAVVVLSNVSAYHPSNSNIDKLAYDLLKLEYINQNGTPCCEAPFIEIAHKKGWSIARRDSLSKIKTSGNSIVGVWHKTTNGRTVTRTFFDDNKVQTDFFKGPEIDVWGHYSVNNDTITLSDVGGEACISDGEYRFIIRNDSLTFSVLDDDCQGRKLGLESIWVRKINE